MSFQTTRCIQMYRTPSRFRPAAKQLSFRIGFGLIDSPFAVKRHSSCKVRHSSSHNYLSSSVQKLVRLPFTGIQYNTDSPKDDETQFISQSCAPELHLRRTCKLFGDVSDDARKKRVQGINCSAESKIE